MIENSQARFAGLAFNDNGRGNNTVADKRRIAPVASKRVPGTFEQAT